MPGRNDPCLCGSGKKFKKCCLNRKNSPHLSSPQIFESNYPDIESNAQKAMEILQKYDEYDAFFVVFCMNAWANNRSNFETAFALHKALLTIRVFGTERIDDYQTFHDIVKKLIVCYPVSVDWDYVVNDFGEVKLWFFDRFYPVLIGTGHQQVYTTLSFLPYIAAAVDKMNLVKRCLVFGERIFSGLADSNIRNKEHECLFECPSQDFFDAAKSLYQELVSDIDSQLVDCFGNPNMPIERLHFISRNGNSYPLFNASLLIDCYSYLLSNADKKTRINHVNYMLHDLLSYYHEDQIGDIPTVLHPIGRILEGKRVSKETYLFLAKHNHRIVMAICADDISIGEVEDEIRLIKATHSEGHLAFCEKKSRSNTNGQLCCLVKPEDELNIIAFDSSTDITQARIQLVERDEEAYHCSALDLASMLIFAEDILEIDRYTCGEWQDEGTQAFSFSGRSSEFLIWKQRGFFISPGALTYNMVSFDNNTEELFLLEKYETDFIGYPFAIRDSLFQSPFAWHIKPYYNGFTDYQSKASPKFGGYGKLLSNGGFLFFSHNLSFFNAQQISQEEIALYPFIDDVNMNCTLRYIELFETISVFRNKLVELLVLTPQVAHSKIGADVDAKLSGRYVYSEILVDETAVRFRYVVNEKRLLNDSLASIDRHVQCLYFCELFEPLENIEPDSYQIFKERIIAEMRLPKLADVQKIELDYYVDTTPCPYRVDRQLLHRVQKEIANICFNCGIRTGMYTGIKANRAIRALQDALIKCFEEKVERIDRFSLHVVLLSMYASSCHDMHIHRARYGEFDLVDSEVLHACRERTLELREREKNILPVLQLLIETNLELSRSGTDPLNSESLSELILFSERLLLLFQCADMCAYNQTQTCLEFHVTNDYLTLVSQGEVYEKEYLNLKRRMMQNEDYSIKIDCIDKEYFKEVTNAFEPDTGINYYLLIDFLDFLSLAYPSEHLEDEERWNVFTGNRNEIVNEFICWAEEENYNKLAVGLVIDFLTIDQKALKILKGIKRDFIPINERENRDNRFDAKPLLIIDDKMYFSPAVARELKHKWFDGLLDFMPPYEYGLVHVVKALDKWRCRYQVMMVQDIAKLFRDHCFEIVLTERELCDIDRAGNHPKELGDYDVIAVNISKKEVWIIESKVIKKVGSVFEDQMQQKGFFQQNKYDKKFQRRIDYFTVHMISILTALKIDDPSEFRVLSYMVVNKVFSSRYKQIKFPIISYHELEKILDDRGNVVTGQDDHSL